MMKRVFSIVLATALPIIGLPLPANAQFLFRSDLPTYPPYTDAECNQALQRLPKGKQALQQNSDRKVLQTLVDIGMILEDCEKFDQALDAYQTVYKVNPEYYSPVLKVLVKQGTLDQAEAFNIESWKIRPIRQSWTEDQLNARSLTEIGKILAQNRQFTLAQSYFRNATQFDPSYFQPYQYLGELFVKQGQLKSAFEAFEHEISTSPANFSQLQRQATAAQKVGYALRAQGDRERAVIWYHKAIATHPTDQDAYYQLSSLWAESQNYEQASLALNPILKKDPLDRRVHNDLGYIRIYQGRYKDAIAHFKQVLADRVSDPEHASYARLGQQLTGLKRYADAAEAHKYLTSLDPSQPSSFLSYGENLAHLQNWDAAIQALRQAQHLTQKASQQSSTALPIAFELANALAKVNQAEEAIQVLAPFIKEQKGHTKLYQVLGELHLQMGNVAEATKFFEHSIQAGGYWWMVTTPEAKKIAAHGQGLVNLNRYQDAIPYFQEALAIDPNFAWAYRELGQALRHQNRLEESVLAYQQAIQHKPRDRDLTHTFFSGLGLTLLAQNKLDASHQALQQALTYQPQNIEAQYGLGQVLLKQGKVSAAIASFESVLQLEPHHSEAQVALTDAMKQTRR